MEVLIIFLVIVILVFGGFIIFLVKRNKYYRIAVRKYVRNGNNAKNV